MYADLDSVLACSDVITGPINQHSWDSGFVLIPTDCEVQPVCSVYLFEDPIDQLCGEGGNLLGVQCSDIPHCVEFIWQ